MSHRFQFARLSHRLAASITGLLLLIGLAALAVGWQLRQIEAANAQIGHDRERLSVLSDWIGVVQANLARAVTATRLEGSILDDETTRNRLAPLSARLTEDMAIWAKAAAESQRKVNAITADADEGLRELVNAVEAGRLRFVAKRAQIRDDLLMGEGAQRIDAELLPLSRAMQEALDHVRTRVEEQSANSAAALSVAVTRSQGLLAGSLFAAVLIGSLLVWRTARAITRPIAVAADFAAAIARGDLARRIVVSGRDEIAQLQLSLQDMQQSLHRLVSQVQNAADTIHGSGADVAAGNLDLSTRTEQAASSLQRTASAMAQLAATVRQSAEAASAANQLASSATGVAQRGGSVVAQVVHTMDEINASSKKIADITGVIDGIAFRTNILALNAAVEAARAGEQGRGFAVVASEVRSLAQRSAAAAKEIKELIGGSVAKVDAGATLVADAGATMNEIVVSVQRVKDIIGEIAGAANEQSQGIEQVHAAIADLEQVTQQNSALVEQSAAAAEALKDQSVRLTDVVAAFRLSDSAVPGAPRREPDAAPAHVVAARSAIERAGARAAPAKMPAATTAADSVSL